MEKGKIVAVKNIEPALSVEKSVHRLFSDVHQYPSEHYPLLQHLLHHDKHFFPLLEALACQQV